MSLRTASSRRPSAAVTFASPTGPAGPDGPDGPEGVGEGADADGRGTDGTGDGVHDGADDCFGELPCCESPGDSSGAGGVLHPAVARIASPHAAAAAIVPCLIEIRPRAAGTRVRGQSAVSPGTATRQAGAAQPKLGISPTVVDMSITAKAAPCGSVTAANRPNGLSIGPKCSFPPCFWVFATASSQSGTPK